MPTTTAHRPVHITAAERAALEAAALTSLLDKLAPGNTTMAMLRRTARRTTAELLAPHLAQIDAAIARRRSSPEIEVVP